MSWQLTYPRAGKGELVVEEDHALDDADGRFDAPRNEVVHTRHKVAQVRSTRVHLVQECV